MNRTLGVDPGTGRLGWAILEKNEGKIVVVDCGLIESKANTPLSERLELIYRKLDEVIDKYTPNALAIEELFFVKNVKTGISVAHARGVAILLAAHNKMEIFEYKPNEIKLGICGYGHADKKQMSKMIELHIRGCKIKQDDTADAIAVALYSYQVKKY
jgi:crossover junction endodeoxyribonuclease RuvC